MSLDGGKLNLGHAFENARILPAPSSIQTPGPPAPPTALPDLWEARQGTCLTEIPATCSPNPPNGTISGDFDGDSVTIAQNDFRLPIMTVPNPAATVPAPIEIASTGTISGPYNSDNGDLSLSGPIEIRFLVGVYGTPEEQLGKYCAFPLAGLTLSTTSNADFDGVPFGAGLDGAGAVTGTYSISEDSTSVGGADCGMINSVWKGAGSLRLSSGLEPCPEFTTGTPPDCVAVPPETVIDSGPGATINTTDVGFSFHGDPAGNTAKIQCSLDSGSFTDCTSPWIFTDLSESSHTVSFRAESAGGIQDPDPATRTFTVDKSALGTPFSMNLDGGRLNLGFVFNNIKILPAPATIQASAPPAPLTALPDLWAAKLQTDPSPGACLLETPASCGPNPPNGTVSGETVGDSVTIDQDGFRLPIMIMPHPIDSSPVPFTVASTGTIFGTYDSDDGDLSLAGPIEIRLLLGSAGAPQIKLGTYCAIPLAGLTLSTTNNSDFDGVPFGAGLDGAGAVTGTYSVTQDSTSVGGASCWGVDTVIKGPGGLRLSSGLEPCPEFTTGTPPDCVPVPPDTLIDSGPDGTVNTTEASFSFHGDPAANTAKVQCKLDGGSFTDCTSPWTFTALGQGSHTVSIRAESAGGTRDPSPATRTFTVDSSAQVDPFTMNLDGGKLNLGFAFKNSSILPAPSSIESTPLPDLWQARQGTCLTGAPSPCGPNPPNGTVSGEIVRGSVSIDQDGFRLPIMTVPNPLDGSPVPVTVASTGRIFGAYDPANGALSLAGPIEIRVLTNLSTDPLGEYCALPLAGLTLSTTSNSDFDGVPFAAGSGGRGAITGVYSISENSTSVGDADCGVIDTAVRGDGSLRLSGSLNTPDNIPPVVEVTSGPSGTSNSANASFVFRASERAVSFQCQLDGSAFSSCTSPKSYSSLAAGSHTFQVKGTDPAGNQSLQSATRQWTYSPSSTSTTTTGTAQPGGAVSTDPGNTGPTAEKPTTAAISVPNGGEVEIIQEPSSGPAPAGFSVVGQVFRITAPDATVSEPLALSFRLESSALPNGVNLSDLTVMRDGVAAVDCTASDGTATPDPCVSSREELPDGDVVLTVLSSHASEWIVAHKVAPPKPRIGKVSVSGPKKVKRGKNATFRVKVSNSGGAGATGVRLKVSGSGVSANKSPGRIAAKKSKTVKVVIRPKKPGRVQLTFKVTSSNAGGKVVRKSITVKRAGGSPS